MQRSTHFIALIGVVFGALLFGLGGACQRTNKPTQASPAQPSLRIYALSNLAGALEPCGCQKDMLGGVDHLAALLESGGKKAPSLVVGAGPLFFMDPRLDEVRAAQDRWKASALAESMGDLKLSAWAPGYNDWAAGQEYLKQLVSGSGASLLAANLEGIPGAKATRLVQVGNYQVGIAGVSLPEFQTNLPSEINAKEMLPALKQARDELLGQKAQLLVALVSAPRGEVLRLAELAEGFHLMVVGKPFDQGEANDKPTPPTLIGKTLVVQAQNHAQSLAVVDVFVRDGSFELQDGSGLEAASERESLVGRIADLERRITAWERSGSLKPAELAKQKQDLTRLKVRLSELSEPAPPESGSYFRYELTPVNETAGASEQVTARLLGYYKRVNEHNKEAFKDKRPPPVPEGGSGYIGVEKCATCHSSAYEFWKKTSHAKAYSTLTVQHKEFNLDCVSCHVTGYEKPGGSTVTFVEGLTNVQCESCHGPGEQHMKKPNELGLITRVPQQSVCVGCHHPPHVSEDWDANHAWQFIVGPGHGR